MLGQKKKRKQRLTNKQKKTTKTFMFFPSARRLFMNPDGYLGEEARGVMVTVEGNGLGNAF